MTRKSLASSDDYGISSFIRRSEDGGGRVSDNAKQEERGAGPTPVPSISGKAKCNGLGAGFIPFAPFSEYDRNKSPRKDYALLTASVPVVKVIGVGGGACNAVGHMVSSGLKGVTFIAANTDKHALAFALADHTIQLDSEYIAGKNGTKRRVAEESLASVKDAIDGAHLVFIVAGMGGNTGSGTAPAIANAAREAGALTVGIATTPVRFEGRRRAETAEIGITELRRCVDFLIVIPLDRLRQTVPKKTDFLAFLNMADFLAFLKMADETILTAVRSISDALTQRNVYEIEFAKVASLLAASNLAGMGTGSASGENRASNAANPLLAEAHVAEANSVLITITAGPGLEVEEVDEVKSIFASKLREGAAILICTIPDETLTGELRISYIATTA